MQTDLDELPSTSKELDTNLPWKTGGEVAAGDLLSSSLFRTRVPVVNVHSALIGRLTGTERKRSIAPCN